MGEMGTAPVGSLRGTGWAIEGETRVTEEVAGGIIGATRGVEVEAEVIGASHGMKGEARVVVAARGEREVDEVIGRAGGPPEGVVGPSTSTTQAVRLPGGTV
jgi:hypothetical protein